MKQQKNSILPIGDCHVYEEDDLTRFHILGKFILDKKPTHIVFMGDFLTLNCLSNWDRNKRMRMENKRYSLEVDVGNEALDAIFAPVDKYNKFMTKTKRKKYRPTIVYLEGNHENRLTRYLEVDPTFDGFVSVQKDLLLKKRKIIYVPYREYFYINGIGFTHIPFNEAKEISGVDITKKASLVTFDSVVFAHTHKLERSNWHKQGQKHLQQILSVGCYFQHHEDYVHGRVTRYWKGLVLLDNWKEGRFDIECHALSKLQREYNDKGD